MQRVRHFFHLGCTAIRRYRKILLSSTLAGVTIYWRRGRIIGIIPLTLALRIIPLTLALRLALTKPTVRVRLAAHSLPPIALTIRRPDLVRLTHQVPNTTLALTKAQFLGSEAIWIPLGDLLQKSEVSGYEGETSTLTLPRSLSILRPRTCLEL